MSNSKPGPVICLLFVLLLPADASGAALETVVTDYCAKNRCADTAIDAIASVFKGVELAVSPLSINAYNCGNSDFLNLTVESPMLSTDSELLVNGKTICEIRGSLLPKTEMCAFFIAGGNGGDEGSTNVMINAVVRSEAGVLSPVKEYSKNFGVTVKRLQSNDEKDVIAAMKSAEISLMSAAAKITEYENADYNMSAPRKTLDEAETKSESAKDRLNGCHFSGSLAEYRESKRLADAATTKAASERASQNNEKLGAITGSVVSSASDPVTIVLLGAVAILGYSLHKEKRRNKNKLDL